MEEKIWKLSTDYAEVIFNLDGHYDDTALVRTINASDVARHIEQMYVDYKWMHMSYEISSVFTAKYNIRQTANNRGVKIVSHLCECDFEEFSTASDDKLYGIWSNQFIETVSGLMIYLSNDNVTVYFHGRYERVVPVQIKNLKPEPTTPTC